MKFLLAGNLVNHGYFLGKLLRNNGFEADLLIRKNPKLTEDPKFLDKDILEYPEWIKFWDDKKFTWKFQVVKLMRKYDLIQASTELPIFASVSGKSFISFTTGADVVKLANEKSFKGFLLRLAYKKSKAVIFPAPYLYKYVKKLHIENNLFIPLLWDYEKFQPKNISKNNEKFVIFHPTNHLWYYKKNDRFLRAFTRLIKEKNKIHLIIINRGSDFEKSLEIIKDAIQEKKVTILPETIPQSELVNFYHNADLIVDQFGVGSTGLIGQETMACGKPLLQFVDIGLYKKFYREPPPILNAENEDEIYCSIMKLLNDPKLGVEIGKKSREWLLKYHDHSKIIRKYIYLYNAINDKENFNEIKETIRVM